MRIYFICLILLLSACQERCPDLRSPHMLVTFEGNYPLIKINGIGGGKLTWEGKDTTFLGIKRTHFLLELSPRTTTTAYVFERNTKKDTLTIEAQYNPVYEKRCGFYLTTQNFNIRLSATSIPSNKLQMGSGSMPIASSFPYQDSYPHIQIKE